MQNTKDSFYEVLRGRLASLDPDRTVVVRGVTRPAILVDENETQSVANLPECFHLRWTEQIVTKQSENPLVTLTCEISYGTSGSKWTGGLDRGRTLAALDAALLNIVQGAPQRAPKVSYAGLVQGGSPVQLQTNLWWSDLTWGAIRTETDRVERTAVVQVMSYVEVGEA